MEHSKSNIILCDLEAEKQLLGLILIDNNILTNLLLELSENSFYYDENKIFFKTIKKLIQEGKQADKETLYFNILDRNKLSYNNEELKEVIDSLIDYAAGAICQSVELVNILNFYKKKREVLSLRENIDILLNSMNIDEVNSNINQLFDKISSISIDSAEKKNVLINTYAHDIIDKLVCIKNNDIQIGISSGFLDLDNIIGNFNDGNLIIIAARPSMGKTALMTSIAYNIASNLKKKVGIFSLEMTTEQITGRLISMNSDYSMYTITTGYMYNDKIKEKINDSDLNNIKNSANYVSSLPIYVSDDSNIDISDLVCKMIYLKIKLCLDIIIIDYLQLITAKNTKYTGSRVLEISEITRILKSIAKKLNIPIIVLSQLSRKVEEREDKIPQLSDLRESGAIEQDADIVMFLYREEYYLTRKKPTNTSEDDKIYSKWKEKYDKVKNIAEIIVAKNRNGRIGKCLLEFDKKKMKFSNISEKEKDNIKNVTTDFNKYINYTDDNDIDDL